MAIVGDVLNNVVDKPREDIEQHKKEKNKECHRQG